MKKKIDIQAPMEVILPEKDQMVEDRMLSAFTPRPELKLITGGKSPPIGGDGSWLSELELGTVFLGQDDRDHSKWALATFQKMKVSPNTMAVMLASDVFPEKYMWVNPGRFSKAFRKVDILAVIDLSSIQQEEAPNDQGSVQPSGVADDANAPAEHPSA